MSTRISTRVLALFAALIVLIAAASFTYSFYGSILFQSQEYDLLHFGAVSFPVVIAILYFVRVAIMGTWSIRGPDETDDT